MLELSQVPPEERWVADELVRGHFEQDDHARLVELAGATIHELDPERRLPRPGGSREEDDVPPRNAAEKDFVEPLDSCLDQVRFRHMAPRASSGLLDRCDGARLAISRGA